MLIIFDLDGTLIDSAKDLAISMNATRRRFGLPPLDEAVIYSYVGNGAPMLVRRAMGPDASEELLEEALKFFLQFYRTHALEHTQFYPGIREVILELAQSNTLGVLTNKPVRISVDIIGALGLQSSFFRVYGGDSFAGKKPDPIGVLTLLREAGTSTSDTLLVGDSGVDVRTARNAGVRSCGVVWGFQPEAFKEDPPDVLIQTPPDLLRLVNGFNSLQRS